MSKINELVATLNAITDKNIFEIYIPSLKRTVKFRPLTAKQQRAFYTCVNEKTVFNTQFILTTFNIIKGCCTESNLIPVFNIFDRAAILIALRVNTLGNLITVLKDEQEFTVDLTDCLQQFKSLELPICKDIAVQNILINLQIPTLLEQYELEKELRDKEIDTMPFSSLLEDVITGEVCKLIKEINIEQVAVGYKNLNFKDKATVVESLPASIVFELQDFAQNVNTKLSECLTCPVKDNDTIAFDITVDFFLDR